MWFQYSFCLHESPQNGVKYLFFLIPQIEKEVCIKNAYIKI